MLPRGSVFRHEAYLSSKFVHKSLDSSHTSHVRLFVVHR